MAHRLLNEEQELQIHAALSADRLIEAIKLYREATGASLAEAKSACEAMRDGKLRQQVGTSTSPVAMSEVERFLQSGNKIGAIKAYREATGVGLAEAKAAVEAIEAGGVSAASSVSPLNRGRKPLPTSLQKRGGCLGVAVMLASLAMGVLTTAGTVLAAPAEAPVATAAKPELLDGVKRILVVGDSITYGGHYVDVLEAELLLANPKRQLEVINVGLPSETVSGLSEAGHAGGKFPRPDLHERLDRVLAKTKPDLVIACYGMNDGIYLPLSDERAKAFQDGMIKLHNKAVAAGAKVIHLTPPPFDPLPIKARVAPADKVDSGHPFEGYDGVLAAYGKWLLDMRTQGWNVADVGGAMREAIANNRKANPGFTYSRDGVHPDAAGHNVMAETALRYLGIGVDPKDRFGDPADPKSPRAQVRKLVHERARILLDAWLGETGHKRPGMKAGLPLDQAKQKGFDLSQRVQSLVDAVK